MGDGWAEYRGQIHRRLATIEEQNLKILDAQRLIFVEIAKLKVKSGVWGAIAGAFPAVVALIIVYLRGI